MHGVRNFSEDEEYDAEWRLSCYLGGVSFFMVRNSFYNGAYMVWHVTFAMVFMFSLSADLSSYADMEPNFISQISNSYSLCMFISTQVMPWTNLTW